MAEEPKKETLIEQLLNPVIEWTKGDLTKFIREWEQDDRVQRNQIIVDPWLKF